MIVYLCACACVCVYVGQTFIVFKIDYFLLFHWIGRSHLSSNLGYKKFLCTSYLNIIRSSEAGIALEH